MPQFNPLLPIATTPVLSARYHFQFLSQTVVNTLYWQMNAAPETLPVLADTAALVDAAIRPEWLAALSESTQLYTSHWRWMNHPETPFVNLEYNDTFGDREGDPITSVTTLRIYRKTNVGGKHGRGMMRLGGLSEDDTNGNFITLGFEATIDALITAFASGVTGGVLGANVLLPALATIVPQEEAPAEFIVRSAPAPNWSYTNRLGHQLTRARRSVV